MGVLGSGDFEVESVTVQRVWVWVTRVNKLCKEMRSHCVLDNGTIAAASYVNRHR